LASVDEISMLGLAESAAGICGSGMKRDYGTYGNNGTNGLHFIHF
jgi:hypothetical protein